MSATLCCCNSRTTLSIEDYLKLIIMGFLCFVRGYSIVFHLMQSTKQRKMTSESDDYSSMYVCFIVISAHVPKERKKCRIFSPRLDFKQEIHDLLKRLWLDHHCCGFVSTFDLSNLFAQRVMKVNSELANPCYQEVIILIRPSDVMFFCQASASFIMDKLDQL